MVRGGPDRIDSPLDPRVELKGGIKDTCVQGEYLQSERHHRAQQSESAHKTLIELTTDRNFLLSSAEKEDFVLLVVTLYQPPLRIGGVKGLS